MDKAGSASEDMEIMARQITHSSQTQQKCYAIHRGVDKAISVVRKMEETRKSAHKHSRVSKDPLESTSDEDSPEKETSSSRPTPPDKETSEEEEDDKVLELLEEEEVQAVQVSSTSFLVLHI